VETPGKRIAGGRYEMSAVIAGVWDRRRLTTPHKLQGRGEVGKPQPYREGVSMAQADRWPRPDSFMR
jgi:hypothetical protein